MSEAPVREKVAEKTLRILVLDDEERTREGFAKAIEQVFEDKAARVNAAPWAPGTQDIEELERREEEFRREGCWEPKDELPMDQADILVLDWDLLFLKEGSKNAEPWAYLARCFSKAGIILMVNRWNGLPNPFDLGLRGDPFQREDQRSFADLDVGGDQLAMLSLWLGRGLGTQDEDATFHPWYWPVLTTLVDDWPQRVEDVTRVLMEKPCTTVREFFRFDEESWRWLPRKARTFLDAASGRQPCREKGKEGGPYLIDLLAAGRGWSYKHQRVVHERLASLLKGSLNADEWEKTVHNVARPIAGLLSKWLEWLVLPEQDVLVDAPHLAERFPSLVGEKATEGDWQALAWRRGDGPRPQGLIRFEEKLEVHRFLPKKKEFWLSRPLWKWRSVKDDESIPEVEDPWRKRPDVGIGNFKEDASRFAQVEEKVWAFEADVESPFRKRFVEKYGEVTYIPRNRLL